MRQNRIYRFYIQNSRQERERDNKLIICVLFTGLDWIRNMIQETNLSDISITWYLFDFPFSLVISIISIDDYSRNRTINLRNELTKDTWKQLWLKYGWELIHESNFISIWIPEYSLFSLPTIHSHSGIQVEDFVLIEVGERRCKNR